MPRRAVIFALILVCVVALIFSAYHFYFQRPLVTPSVKPAEHLRISTNALYTVSHELAAEVLRIEAREKQIAETLWSAELLAQQHGSIFEHLWDTLNASASSNRWSILAGTEFSQILLPNWKTFIDLPHQIQTSTPGGNPSPLPGAGWAAFLSRFQRDGWTLQEVEFRHIRFAPPTNSSPARSQFYFAAHLENPNPLRRAQIDGNFTVRWGEFNPETRPSIASIDATGLTLKLRAGEPIFKTVLDTEITPQGQSKKLDPLILYDLDLDGLSEIILAGRNLVYRNRGNFRFEPEPLCKFPEEFISTALIADFDGDNTADFLCKKWEGLFLFHGSPTGRFEHKPAIAWKPLKPLAQPMVMTCGDIDSDGDLDLFIAQYKEPYEGGFTPQPFYNANDGAPAYLLLNDGAGHFRDDTETCGLAPKRHRRTYSASFADLNSDRHLDLLVVSDFAGLDLYQNDGTGRFTDVTPRWIDNPHAFGMAHALADFNNDARLDLLMIGMTSPAADRLNHLRLWRNDTPVEREMRRAMTHGNRLYFGVGATNPATHSSDFRMSALSDSISRSGWSWGCAAFDFDNDTFADAYIGNGLESNSSIRDYEPEYWLHDRYFTSADSSSATDLYFRAKFSRTRARDHSYGGHEKNRFYLNRAGREFIEVGYLLGVALPDDSRNVVSDDLDGDGRVDLLVKTEEIWPRLKQNLKIFQNGVSEDSSQNWIAFRLEGESQASPGALVKLYSGSNLFVRQIITGDSYRSQHAPTAHFGLGEAERVNKVEIHRIGKPVQILQSPAVNRYHRLSFR